jgi:hypothetical protein
MRRASYSRDRSSTWKISYSVTNILMQLTKGALEHSHKVLENNNSKS